MGKVDFDNHLTNIYNILVEIKNILKERQN